MRPISASICERRQNCMMPCFTSYGVARPILRHAGGRPRPVARASPMNMSDLIDRQFSDMDRQFEIMQRQMDRDIDGALSRARALERQADAELQRARSESASSLRMSLREEMRPAPNVDIQRQEERGPGVYRYYERIQITSGRGGAYTSQLPPPAAATSVSAVSPLSPALLGAMVVVGGYVALTAAFNRNYQLTIYAESKRWLLTMLWPLLLLFSPKFREQFAAAVRGERAGTKRGGPDGGAGSRGGSRGSQ